MGMLGEGEDRKSTRLNSSHSSISYAVFCLKKKTFELLRNASLEKSRPASCHKENLRRPQCVDPRCRYLRGPDCPAHHSAPSVRALLTWLFRRLRSRCSGRPRQNRRSDEDCACSLCR